MNIDVKTWDDVRRIADELELKIHLAGMSARDRWRELQPRLIELEHEVARSSKRLSETVDRELTALGAALRSLRDELSPPHD